MKYTSCQFNPTLPLQQLLTLLLPGAWACRPDLIPRDPVWRRLPLGDAFVSGQCGTCPGSWSLPDKLGPVAVHPTRLGVGRSGDCPGCEQGATYVRCVHISDGGMAQQVQKRPIAEQRVNVVCKALPTIKGSSGDVTPDGSPTLKCSNHGRFRSAFFANILRGDCKRRAMRQ